MPAERSGSVGWVDLNKVGTPGFAEEYYRKNFGVNVGAYRSAPVRAPAPAFTSVPASSVSPVDEIRRRRDVALWNAQRADPEARQGYRDAADECLREEADTLWNNPFPAAGGIWSHNAVIAHRTGKEVDFEDWQVEREQSVKIEEQTEVIARKLEAAGSPLTLAAILLWSVLLPELNCQSVNTGQSACSPLSLNVSAGICGMLSNIT